MGFVGICMTSNGLDSEKYIKVSEIYEFWGKTILQIQIKYQWIKKQYAFRKLSI